MLAACAVMPVMEPPVAILGYGAYGQRYASEHRRDDGDLAASRRSRDGS